MKMLAAELTAAGLWQSLDEESHQPNAWFLIRDNGGLYEGKIVRMFMKPGENPNVVCDLRKDDRRGKLWLGLDIIRGMKRNGAEYTDGTILDPRDGDLYSAKMTLTPDGAVKIPPQLPSFSPASRFLSKLNLRRYFTPSKLIASMSLLNGYLTLF